MTFVLTRRRFRSAAVFALCATWAAVAGAGAIYKYRDADGIVHYTDQRPGGRQQVEVFQLFGSAPEQQRTVFIEKRGNAKQDIVVVNQNQAPVEVSFKLTKQDNVRAQSIPAQWIVPANSEVRIASLQAQNAGAPLNYDYQMRWQLGNPNARHNEAFAYSPPVPVNSVFTISQGFNGNFSHDGEGNRYAIDIGMPIGTGIRAARGGSIAVVKDSFSDVGGSVASRGQTNAIYVLHDDGTFGVYAHLKRNSALVRPGQRVQAGQIIAQSGNSGYSTGPHLHFAILRNAGLKWQSVPFLLASPYGVMRPAKGLAVTGMQPPMIRVASN
ncbi:MAG: M23 family metallopeptidase [Spongiibacteraceae bacterium]